MLHFVINSRTINAPLRAYQCYLRSLELLPVWQCGPCDLRSATSTLVFTVLTDRVTDIRGTGQMNFVYLQTLKLEA